MFENLSNQLGKVFDRLKRRGVLSEADVHNAVREVRIALLEADVALPVVKRFIEQVEVRAVGQEVTRSVTPGQMVVKIVYDTLIDTLGTESVGLALSELPPTVVVMVGLQGSGKTTASAKIALRLKRREQHKVLMASLDIYRPAAQEQLSILGQQINVATLPIVPNQKPLEIAKRAIRQSHDGSFDTLLLDTAGRLHIDRAMVAEIVEICNAVMPTETLLVADAMTGQDAANVASAFSEQVRLTGVILTKIDSDTRGGAALSIRTVTGLPIKLLSTGEKLDALEDFHPDRLARSILGMSDVVSLVERAGAILQKEEAEQMAVKMLDGRFDLQDLLLQLRQIRKMGDLKGLIGLLPGISKLKRQFVEARIDNKLLFHQEAIILAMTPGERHRPEIIKASRKKRIAAGCGLTVPDVNRLLKQHQKMAQITKGLQRIGRKGLLDSLFNSKRGPFPSLSLMEESLNGPVRGKDRTRFPERRRK